MMREWHAELFLRPGDWVPWVGASVIGTVLALGGVVWFLHGREKVSGAMTLRLVISRPFWQGRHLKEAKRDDELMVNRERMNMRGEGRCMLSTSRLCRQGGHLA